MARAALYHRVSTLDQNPEIARVELRQAAAVRGCNVVMDVEETGSGARNDRLGHRRIMAAARKGEIDVVLVWKLDRFGRSALDLLSNIDALKRCGVRFVATTQGLDIKPEGDAMSELILTVLSAFAQFERDLIRERTRLGLAAARRKGTKLGRREDKKVGVEKVAALRAQAKSWSEIATALDCTVAMARRRVVQIVP